MTEIVHNLNSLEKVKLYPRCTFRDLTIILLFWETLKWHINQGSQLWVTSVLNRRLGSSDCPSQAALIQCSEDYIMNMYISKLLQQGFSLLGFSLLVSEREWCQFCPIVSFCNFPPPPPQKKNVFAPISTHYKFLNSTWLGGTWYWLGANLIRLS